MDMYFTDLIYTSCCLFDGKQYILLLYLFLCPSLASYNLFFFLSYFSLRVSRGGKFTKSFFFYFYFVVLRAFFPNQTTNKGNEKVEQQSKTKNNEGIHEFKSNNNNIDRRLFDNIIEYFIRNQGNNQHGFAKKKENQRK